MKKYFIALILLLAAGCSKTPPVSTPPVSSPTANWQTYNYNDAGLSYYGINEGFSFKYPEGWTIRQDENPRALLEMYDAQSSASLVSCLQNPPKIPYSNQVSDCGQQASNLQVMLMPDEFVNYDTLDAWLKTDYPGYEKVNVPGLDVFFYTGGADTPANFDYHINTPDKESGLYFESLPNGDQTEIDQQILGQIVQTFSFLTSPLPAFTSQELSVKYNNTQYGFVLSLPAAWQGYSVYSKTVQGTPLEGSKYKNPVSIPVVYIRNPNWTAANPYEDIPVMVLTIDEWNEVQNETLAVSAAPIPPTELGRNQTYVFALPPRYDYDFKTGFQEVEKIMQSNPLKAN